ncbi:hypothetical protein [Thalassotalea atypica]|uniref:hypothetical protein n=1 Tax=Thalassotalea atypica TaxID=2054316 RepID=UPI0025742C0E|nr:hypothetical protein [Thalassotalea atypica]
MFFSFALSVQAFAKEYVVGVEDINYYPLFNFSSKSIDHPSFTRDLLISFFEAHQLKFRFVALPIKRFDRWYIEQDIDFKFPDNSRWRVNSKDKLNIIYSDPVLQLEAGTYVRIENKNIEKKSVRKLVTVLGFYPTLWLDEVANKQVIMHEETVPLSIVKHVLYGNADGTNIDPNVIRSHLKQINKENEIVLAPNIKHEKYFYHLSSIKHPEIIQLFNIFLKDNPEILLSLKHKYGIEE